MPHLSGGLLHFGGTLTMRKPSFVSEAMLSQEAFSSCSHRSAPPQGIGPLKLVLWPVRHPFRNNRQPSVDPRPPSNRIGGGKFLRMPGVCSELRSEEIRLLDRSCLPHVPLEISAQVQPLACSLGEVSRIWCWSGGLATLVAGFSIDLIWKRDRQPRLLLLAE